MAEGGRRTARLELRLTEAEAERIRNRAEASGLSVGAYVRRAALAGAEPTPVADVRELRPIYVELRRCGGDVSQVARALAARGESGTSVASGEEDAAGAAVVEALAALERACDAVADAMIAARPRDAAGR